MPIIPYRKEEEIMKVIRRAMIKDPMYTTTGIQIALAKAGYETSSGHALHRQYVEKLMRKIKAGAEHYSSHELELERITKTRERYNLVAERLFKIAFWDLDSLREMIPMPTVGEQVSALKAIVELDLKLFEAERIAGLFMKQGEKLGDAEWRFRPMPSEFYENVVKAFSSHGFGPDRLKEIAARADAARAAAATPIHGTDITSTLIPAAASAAKPGVVG